MCGNTLDCGDACTLLNLESCTSTCTAESATVVVSVELYRSRLVEHYHNAGVPGCGRGVSLPLPEAQFVQAWSLQKKPR